MTRKVRDMEWSQEIGKRIVASREALGLSQDDLAELLLIHKQTLRNYEKGARIPWRDLSKYAEALDVSLRYLLHGHEYVEPLERIERKLDLLLERLVGDELRGELEDAGGPPNPLAEEEDDQAAGGNGPTV